MQVGIVKGDKGNDADKLFKCEHAHGLRQQPQKPLGQYQKGHVSTDGRVCAAAARDALARLRRDFDVFIINGESEFDC